jgi:hypothetical protein
MSTLYTRNGEGVFELPGRTVNTFTSGLVRVDTSYAIKTSNIAAARSVDFQVGSEIVGDSYPAVDGLFLYPEPQEVRREYGMTELMVSYYGRTRTDVPPPTVIERSITSGNGFIISINDLFFEFVVPVGEVINFRDQNLFDTPLSEPNAMYTNNGDTAVNFSKTFVSPLGFIPSGFHLYAYPNIFLGEIIGTNYVNLRKPTMLVIAQRNFGNFVELEVTYKRNTEQDGWINA